MTKELCKWLEQHLGHTPYLPTPKEHPAELRHRLLIDRCWPEVVIFGTGSSGQGTYQTLKHAGVQVRYFLDNTPPKDIDGIPCYQPQDKPVDDLPIILCSVWHMEIYQQLGAMGLLEESREIFPLSLPHFLTGHEFDDMIGWGFYQCLQARLSDFQAAHAILDDQQSKDTFIKILAYRLAALSPAEILPEHLPCPPQRYRHEAKAAPALNQHLPDYLQAAIKGCFTHPQYFLDGFFQPRTGDIVLDCGAWRGDSSYWYNSLVGAQGHVYAFEPDPTNYALLCEQLANFEHPTAVTAIDQAISTHECILDWSDIRDIGTDSRIAPSSKNNCVKVNATSIDAFCAKNNLKQVDIIKTDLEGADFDAIIGAQETIRNHHPDLGISIYHTPNHLVDIPLWIHQHFPQYQIRIHHNFIGYVETICMATQRNKSH